MSNISPFKTKKNVNKQFFEFFVKTAKEIH